MDKIAYFITKSLLAAVVGLTLVFILSACAFLASVVLVQIITQISLQLGSL